MRAELWSVQLLAANWSDDIYTGSYEECVNYCVANDYIINGEEARLARILVEDDYVLEVLEYIEEL